MIRFELKKIFGIRIIIVIVVTMIVFSSYLFYKNRDEIGKSKVHAKVLKEVEREFAVFNHGVKSKANAEEFRVILLNKTISLAFSDDKYTGSVYSSVNSGLREQLDRQDLIDTLSFNSNTSDDLKSFYEKKVEFGIYDSRIAERMIESMSYSGVLIVLLAFVFSSAFAIETDLEPVLHVTRLGRREVYKAKETAAVLGSLLLTVVFFLDDLLTVFIIFDNPGSIWNMPLYAVPGFSSSAHGLTVGDFFFRQLIFSMVVSVLVTEFTLLISKIFRKKPLCAFISLFCLFIFRSLDILYNRVYYSEYETSGFRLMSKVTFDNLYEKNIKYNPFSLLNTSVYLRKVDFTVVGDRLVMQFVFPFIVALLLSAAIHFLIINLNRKNHASFSRKYRNHVEIPEKANCLLFLEFKKIIDKRFVAVQCIIIASWLIYVYVNLFGVYSGTNSNKKNELYSNYEGVLTTEKYKEIQNLYKDTQETLGQEEEMMQKFTSGQLSQNDYAAYMTHFYECRSRAASVKLLYKDIKNRRKNESYVIYPDYYAKASNPAVPAMGILFSVVFTGICLLLYEKKNLLSVLRTSKCGLNKMAKTKILCSIILSFVIALFVVVSENAMLFHFNGKRMLDAPANNLKFLNMLPDRISVLQWLILFAVLRILIATVLSIFISLFMTRLMQKSS